MLHHHHHNTERTGARNHHRRQTHTHKMTVGSEGNSEAAEEAFLEAEEEFGNESTQTSQEAEKRKTHHEKKIGRQTMRKESRIVSNADSKSVGVKVLNRPLDRILDIFLNLLFVPETIFFDKHKYATSESSIKKNGRAVQTIDWKNVNKPDWYQNEGKQYPVVAYLGWLHFIIPVLPIALITWSQISNLKTIPNTKAEYDK